jgi:CRISPR-associated helicase Cas3/CRISPR-associated endonuclease Cas3-HD
LETYYAHSQNKKGEWETVEHHLKRVGKLCAEFAQPLRCDGFGRTAGLLHDAGKYSPLFQRVLRHQQVHVDHAVPGAVLACAFGGKAAHTLGVIIRAHHSSLQEDIRPVLEQALRGTERNVPPKNDTLSVCGPDEYTELMKTVQRETGLDLRHDSLQQLPDLQNSPDRPLAQMLQTRMLYSCLVDADYSATEEFYDEAYLQKASGEPLQPKNLLKSLQKHRDEVRANSTSDKALNAMRDRLYDECVAAAEQRPGLFTLTAPTGMGKTLDLLAFALKHAEKWGQKRIFVVLPYLSIIEQNAKEYRSIVPDLLEVHSQVKATDETRQLAERWAAPLIVTTTVGFLEGLFACHAPDCRRLHQAADSVIVLDEAQSLPPRLLDATLHTLQELCLHYGCTVVLSTATQPAFQYRRNMQWHPREIVPNPQALFASARRVEVEWRVKSVTPLERIADEMAGQKSVCAILNLRRHARRLYDLLKQRCSGDGLFFLSSDLCPAHREKMLKEVRGRLKEKLPCRLVSTQCIEAGVDIDFACLYRALAPLEAVIQAAGRCNRNGGPGSFGRVIVFIPDEEGKLYPDAWYESAANKLRVMLENRAVDLCSLADIEAYYRRVYSDAPEDAKELRDAIKQLDYPGADRAYQVIPSAGFRVIVPYRGNEDCTGLFDAVKKEALACGLTPAVLAKARPITVTTFDKDGVQEFCEPLPQFDFRGRRIEKSTDCFLLDQPKCYDEKTGLYFSDKISFQSSY